LITWLQEMIFLRKYTIPIRQRYLLSCIVFVLLFCWFNYYVILKTKVVQVDIAIDAPQAGTLKIYAPQNGGYSETNKVLQAVTPEQKRYSLRIPCQTDDIDDVHLMIVPINSTETITLHEVSIFLPLFKKVSLDITEQFKDPDNYVNIGKVLSLPGGGVKITGNNNNPFFFVKEKLYLSPVVVATAFISLCSCMWLFFHPTILKGKKQGGLLKVEVFADDWRPVDSLIMELEKCCQNLVLRNSRTESTFQSLLFSFTDINEQKFSAIRSLVDNKEIKYSIRLQMNRSGEL